MSQLKELLDQEAYRIDADPDALESMFRRRDRKRRNQRITAGVVGIAVFVAAVWIVTSLKSLDRSETSVVPGGDVTGPAETGPAETGPTVTGPIIGNTGDPSSVGFDPDAPPSEPARGKLVMSDGGIHPYFVVLLFADGRLIWRRDTTPDQGHCCGGVSVWIEQHGSSNASRPKGSGSCAPAPLSSAGSTRTPESSSR